MGVAHSAPQSMIVTSGADAVMSAANGDSATSAHIGLPGE